ncbi:hypothetical protein GLU26_01120 [Nanohaloarchaea archaeon]|nr:hypothetical protein [Candidatus Nanohaloarchaea archaeon]
MTDSMAERDYSSFRSRLGEVAVSTSHMERDKNDCDDWKALENIPDQKMVNEIHFSDIRQVTYHKGSTYPYIEFETNNGEKKKMFFSVGDPVKDVFTELKERIAVYRQSFE